MSSYLRDAAFAGERFAQRIAQALGRCNRSADDRAVYIFCDPLVRTRLSNPRGLDLLVDDVRADVFAGVRQRDWNEALGAANRFLDGVDPIGIVPPGAKALARLPDATARLEVKGMHLLWAQDYVGAAEAYGRAADGLDGSREYQAFWRAQQAAALSASYRAHQEPTHGASALVQLGRATDAGVSNSFFSRLRAAESRLRRDATTTSSSDVDRVFATWDALIDRVGTNGLERYRTQLLRDLGGDAHDAVAGAIGRLGGMLGLPVAVPKPRDGEPDAIWDFGDPRRRLVFEVKLPTKRQTVSNGDVDQHEGAVRGFAADGGTTFGLLVTTCTDIKQPAEDRLALGRLLRRDELVEWARQVTELLVRYGQAWGTLASERETARASVGVEMVTSDDVWAARAEARGSWVSLG